MAGRFSVCVYNFLETRSTLGEPQLAGGIVLKHVALETARPRAACDARARRLHKETSELQTIRYTRNPRADPNNTLEFMKAIVQTANVEEEAISLKELIPFWFAVSSPLVGILLGLLGAWCVTWLSA